jgi:hypothetical protein
MDVLHVVEAFGTAFVLILAYLWWRDRPKGRTTTIAVPTSVKASQPLPGRLLTEAAGASALETLRSMPSLFAREARDELRRIENAAALHWPQIFAHGAQLDPAPNAAKAPLAFVAPPAAAPVPLPTTKVSTPTGAIRIVNPAGRPIDLKKDENGDLRITIL